MKQKEVRSKLKALPFKIIAVFLLTGLMTANIWGQNLKSIIFTEADNAMSAALNANADILAPKAFIKGSELYFKAEADFKGNKSLTDIQKRLKLSIKEFKAAQKATYIAMTVFGAAIDARNDAIISEAENYGGNHWFNAEKVFKEAAIQLEEGTLKNAQKNSAEAEKLYRQAELLAIKTNLLDEAYGYVKQAEAMKAATFAPQTLDKAKMLIKDAEKALNQNRYDTDEARVLAKQAKREGKHAVYLAGLAQKIKDAKLTTEDVLLASETPLKRIATSMDINLAFESGFKQSTNEIVTKINIQKMTINHLKSDQAYTKERLSLFMAQNQELKNQLGEVNVQKSVLAQQIEAQEKTRKLYDQIEALFAPEEAIIFRENNTLRIRLTGLSFAVGDAKISPKYYAFLAKVVKAVQLFPNSDLLVEGHTDSYGSDATNLKLSNDRANAVKNYMLAHAGVLSEKLYAIGYGESRPIATNENEEGRAKNRRIAVVIQPLTAELE